MQLTDGDEKCMRLETHCACIRPFWQILSHLYNVGTLAISVALQSRKHISALVKCVRGKHVSLMGNIHASLAGDMCARGNTHPSVGIYVCRKHFTWGNTHFYDTGNCSRVR